MKTNLLRIFLISSLLFCGIKNAQAAGTVTLSTITTTAGNNGLAAATLNTTQTAAVLGVKAVGSVSSSTVTKFNFSSIATISTYFTAFRLYSSTISSTYVAGTTAVVPTSSVTIVGTTITATPTAGQVIASGATVYYFLVGDFVPTNSSTTCTFSVSGLTGPGFTSGSPSGPNYTFGQPVTLGSATTTGLAASPLNADVTSVGVMGFSITTTQSTTFTQFNLSASAAVTYLSNYTLYSNTTNTFSTATIVPGASISGAGTTTITVTGLSQTVTSGTPIYYFIRADVSPTTSGTIKLTLNSAVSGVTYTNGGPIAGTNYTVTPPISLSTATTTGFATSPISVAQAGAGIFGFSVAVTGTKAVTQINLAASVAATYFTNYTLYSNTTNTFTTATLVAGASISGAGTTTLTASGFSVSATNATIYFFIKADYTPPATVGTFKLTANSVVSTSTYSNGGPINGNTYTVGPYTYNWVGGTATAGVYLWSTAANWSPASVPGANDNAQIGYATTFTNNPTINTTASVGSITFGSNNSNSMTLTANSTLNVARDITVQADDNSTNTEIVTLAGTGTINAVNVNVISDDDQWDDNSTAYSNYNENLNSSVTNLNLSGNVALTSTFTDDIFVGYQNFYSATFNVTGGTATVAGILSSTNVDRSGTGSTNVGVSYFLVNGGTLVLNNASALSGLDNSGKNAIGFHYVGGTVNYAGTGATQTIYTSSAVNTLSGSDPDNHVAPTAPPSGYSTVKYYNLKVSGTAAETTASGTLTVSNNFTNSANTSLATNSTITSVTGQLVPTSGTLTCGSGTLTAGSMLFSGGNLTAGSGTVTCSGTYTNNGGNFNCGTAASASVIFSGAYLNNSGTFTANPTISSSVSFTGANQSLQDNSTNGTTFNEVNFNGNNTAITAGTGAAGTGNFAVASTGTLTMGASAKLTAGAGSYPGAGYLTLMSTASSTATVAVIPGTSSIQGAVNVQRYITGGSGTRGYRLLSSPVNISTNAGGGGNLGLAYLNTSITLGNVAYPGAFTEGPGTGFTVNGSSNPIMYLYDETRATNNTGFTTGKNIGIYNVASTNVTTLTGTTQAITSIPVGNSYLLYYVGNNSSTVTASTRVPDNTIVTATGYLNQSNVAVKFWKLGTTPIPYDVTTGTTYYGINQIGNPYPSTIKLSTLYSDNYILASNKISQFFWELVPGGSYISYDAKNQAAVSDARASNYIVSGQGFLIQAQAASETITFKEDQKTSYPTLISPFNSTTTNPALLLSIPSNPNLNNNDVAAAASTTPLDASVTPTNTQAQTKAQYHYIHVQLTKDSLNYVQTGIYFNNSNTDKYSQDEDAVNVNGSSAQVFLSTYSSDNVSLSINQLSDYTKGKRIKLYTGAASTGLYNMSLGDIVNIDTATYNVFLVDKKMNDSLDMVHYKSYAFNIDNGDTTTYGANRFILAIERKAMPSYKLIYFTGQKVNTGIQLTWQTLNEGNHTGFSLQKLISTNNYSSLYALQSNSAGDYNYTDKHPVTGNNTYRLQQTDIDGRITYSAPVTINYDSKAPNGSMVVYPNPSRSMITVSLELNNIAKNYVADIYNTSGTVISHQTVNAATWTQDISSYKLGVYIIEVKTNSGDLVGKSKFVKIN